MKLAYTNYRGILYYLPSQSAGRDGRGAGNLKEHEKKKIGEKSYSGRRPGRRIYDAIGKNENLFEIFLLKFYYFFFPSLIGFAPSVFPYRKQIFFFFFFFFFPSNT